MKKFTLIIAVVFLVATISCSPNDEPDSARFVSIPTRGWAYDDAISFQVAPDSTEAYSTERLLAIRHDAAYKYANLWIEIEADCGDTIHTDTMNILLADRYGRPLGRGSGVSFLKIDTLPAHPARHIYIRHIMRIDTLRGIEQIGIVSI